MEIQHLIVMPRIFLCCYRKKLQCQYKDHLSDFNEWKEKKHAKRYLIFPDHIAPHLSLVELFHESIYEDIGISKQAVHQYARRQTVFNHRLMELVSEADDIRRDHPGCGVEKLY